MEIDRQVSSDKIKIPIKIVRISARPQYKNKTTTVENQLSDLRLFGIIFILHAMSSRSYFIFINICWTTIIIIYQQPAQCVTMKYAPYYFQVPTFQLSIIMCLSCSLSTFCVCTQCQLLYCAFITDFDHVSAQILQFVDWSYLFLRQK